MMAIDGHIAEDTLFEPERLRARAIDWDQGDRGLSSGRAAPVLQSRRRIHGRNRHHASINRKYLALREPSIHGSSEPPNGGWTAIHDRAYLQANIAGGEGFDWFYASAAEICAEVGDA
jgi:hypothetical protein